MIRTIIIYHTSTLLALEFVTARICIADSQFKLHIPMAVENQCVSISHTCSGKPSLQTISLQLRYVAYIVYTAVKMGSDEMSGESVTKPVSGFRLDKCVSPHSVTGHIPSIVVAGYIHSPFRSNADLTTDIYGRGSVIKNICLQRKVLRDSRKRCQGRYEEDQ